MHILSDSASAPHAPHEMIWVPLAHEDAVMEFAPLPQPCPLIAVYTLPVVMLEEY